MLDFGASLCEFQEAIYKDLLEEAKFSHEAEFKTYQKKLDSLQVTLGMLSNTFVSKKRGLIRQKLPRMLKGYEFARETSMILSSVARP